MFAYGDTHLLDIITLYYYIHNVFMNTSSQLEKVWLRFPWFLRIALALCITHSSYNEFGIVKSQRSRWNISFLLSLPLAIKTYTIDIAPWNERSVKKNKSPLNPRQSTSLQRKTQSGAPVSSRKFIQGYHSRG